MAEFVFTHPGVKFKERDITYTTRNIGITTLGLVGETLKGPAFEPIFVKDKAEFLSRFGGQSTKKFPAPDGSLQYHLPYAANAYLNESDQLYVTRVLGLSGYDAGTAWAITLNSGLDPATVVTTSGTTYTDNFENNIYMGVTLNASGDTGVSFSGFEKINNTEFVGTSYSFIVTTHTSGGTGTVSVTTTILTGSGYTEYHNMVLGVIRSRANVVDVFNAEPNTVFTTTSLIMSGNTTNIGTGNLYGNFTLNASGIGAQKYVVSLNPNSTNFLPFVIGSEAKDKNTMIYVESIFGDLIQKIDGDGDEFSEELDVYGVSGISPYGYGINTTISINDVNVPKKYKTHFLTPETPWVVSEVKGNTVDRLFKFISISDGNAGNQEIKISIENINPITYEFDVLIRDFNDTDNNIVILENYTKCSLFPNLTSYIARRIGDNTGDYKLNSKYVMVEMAEEVIPTDFPAGFEGYILNKFTNTLPPKIFYKTNYNPLDKVKKTYLGISEKGYSYGDSVGTGINQNLFNFNGTFGESSHVYSKGFHMDINAVDIISNQSEFEVGAGKFQSPEDVLIPGQTYSNILNRKFTLVPAGGFDGWNVHRISRSYTDNFVLNGPWDGVSVNGKPSNDFQAWETAINTFANPEEISINLFATPGIDFYKNTILVKNTVEMIETLRTDSLYVIDSPDDNTTMVVGDTSRADVLAATNIVEKLETADIDSNYACTYFPWIQITDNQNNINLYIPPTGEALASMAYTDNKNYPWYVPAGLDRGSINANKSKFKLSPEAKGILYEGRVNPIVDFPETGTAIMGQKTLQIKQTMLTRINVRRLILRIKVLISNISTKLLFEPNDQVIIDQFKEKAIPTLDSIKRNRGLHGFNIQMDNTNNTPETRDRNELYATISLQPTSAVEFIGIEFVLTPSGASFKD
jgi:hypothetical protein